MATWLDWYISGSAASLGSDVTDFEAAQLMVASGMQHTSDLSQKSFYSVLLPWLMPESERPEDNPAFADPIAYQLSPDLLATLVRGNAPNTDAHLVIMEGHNVYIDLPGRGMPLTDEQSIRAIFIQPTRRPGHWLVVCVLVAGKTNRMSGRYAWIVDRQGQVSDDVGMSVELDLPVATVNTVVYRLIKLTLLYALSVEDKTFLPRVSNASLAVLKPKKRKARQKTHSLFAVRTLSRNAAVNLPGARSDAASWTLDHVIEVSGHFRWQPHGPGGALRKLIWIEEYERGTGEKKPVLTKLELENE
jgi:hypothetical protein